MLVPGGEEEVGHQWLPKDLLSFGISVRKSSEIQEHSLLQYMEVIRQIDMVDETAERVCLR